MTVLMCPQGAQRNHIAHLGTKKPAARSEFCGSSLKVAKMHEGPRVKSSGSSQNFQDAGVKFFRHQSAQCQIAHLGTSAYRIPVGHKQSGLRTQTGPNVSFRPRQKMPKISFPHLLGLTGQTRPTASGGRLVWADWPFSWCLPVPAPKI